ncbi:MAG TPA: class I SAM-dependent methyltransferase [Burkholderiaceae bacterium]
MTDSTPGSAVLAREHYRATGLADRLRTALLAFGPEHERLTPAQLAPLDQFHTRGAAATQDLARLAGIAAADLVLDLGSGVGGPARLLAATCGCDVVGIDLSAEFTEAARYLAERTGQSGRVRFETGDAHALAQPDARFDVVVLQHVAMNIADRATLYREIRRVLKDAGRFATYDIVAGGGAPHYPAPWARTADASFLLPAADTRERIEAAGFRARAWQDDTDVAAAWFAQIAASGPPPAPNLGVVLGPDFPLLTGNLARSLREGRVRVVSGVFEAVAP